MSEDPFSLTRDFNRTICGISEPTSPTRLSPERKEWFVRAAEEELTELEEAQTLEDEVDAIIDLIYFAAGRLYEMGVDGARAFKVVHDCNMLKERGELAKRPGSRGHDAIKPIGWKPPDYSWLSTKHIRHGDVVVLKKLRASVGRVVDISYDGMITVEKFGKYEHYHIDQLEVIA